MKNAFVLIVMCVALPCYAMPPECNLRSFPDFWADAQDQVRKVAALLEQAERDNPYSRTSATQFRQSVKVCEAKRKSIWNEPHASGSAGTASQLKCEALLICSRLAVLEAKF